MSTRPCKQLEAVKAIRAVKLLQYVIANLNLKVQLFFYTPCIVSYSVA